MPNVKVITPKTINVRVNQEQAKLVHGATTFVGAADVQDQVNLALARANEAVATADIALSVSQGAYDTANTKYDKVGGTISGDVNITNNLTVGNTIYAVTETVDAGTF